MNVKKIGKAKPDLESGLWVIEDKPHQFRMNPRLVDLRPDVKALKSRPAKRLAKREEIFEQRRKLKAERTKVLSQVYDEILKDSFTYPIPLRKDKDYAHQGDWRYCLYQGIVYEFNRPGYEDAEMIRQIGNLAPRIKVFSSETEDYHHAFQVFLDNTDQKQKARQWLESFIKTLSRNELFLDAGAGNGKVTAWLAEKFKRAIALEPNPSLYKELRKTCPRVEAHQVTILDANLKTQADFILASLIFYYIPPKEWIPNLARLANWLSPEGVLVVMLQNPDTDCMRMLHHFFKQSFNLGALARELEAEEKGLYKTTLETVPSYITTSDFKSAYTVAEFMMNLLPMPEPPLRKELEAYVEKHFAAGGGQYRFSCHQDFLQIRRPS